MKRKSFSKSGQVWVETVIYTLIGLTIIGLVLAGAMPKINQKKDEFAIEQSIELLGTIDNVIYEVQRAVGNKRIVSLDVKKGYFIVDMEEDALYWTLPSSFEYSQVGLSASIGRFNVTTTGEDKSYEVKLFSKYPFDIRYEGIDSGIKQFDAAPTSYNLIIENFDKKDEKVVINFYEG